MTDAERAKLRRVAIKMCDELFGRFVERAGLIEAGNVLDPMKMAQDVTLVAMHLAWSFEMGRVAVLAGEVGEVGCCAFCDARRAGASAETPPGSAAPRAGKP